MFFAALWTNITHYRLNAFGSKNRAEIQEREKDEAFLPHLSKHTNTIIHSKQEKITKVHCSDWHKAEGEIWSRDKWGVLNRPCLHQSAKVNRMCHLPEVCSVLLSGTGLLSLCSITANTLAQEQVYTHSNTHTHTLNYLHQLVARWHLVAFSSIPDTNVHLIGCQKANT